MITHDTVKYVKRFEERIKRHGFKMVADKWGNSSAISLVPDEDSYPSYSRDKVFASGSMEQLNEFLDGVEWSRDYYRDILKLYTTDKVDKKEQQIRNRITMNNLSDVKTDLIKDF